MKKKYQQLKEVIQKSNPEIRTYENRCMTCGYGFDYCKCNPKKTEWYQDREIRLADVLLALKELEPSHFQEAIKDLIIGKDIGRKIMVWDLKDNNFDNQSDECKKFLIKLLVK